MSTSEGRGKKQYNRGEEETSGKQPSGGNNNKSAHRGKHRISSRQGKKKSMQQLE